MEYHSVSSPEDTAEVESLKAQAARLEKLLSSQKESGLAQPASQTSAVAALQPPASAGAEEDADLMPALRRMSAAWGLGLEEGDAEEEFEQSEEDDGKDSEVDA